MEVVVHEYDETLDVSVLDEGLGVPEGLREWRAMIEFHDRRRELRLIRYLFRSPDRGGNTFGLELPPAFL